MRERGSECESAVREHVSFFLSSFRLFSLGPFLPSVFSTHVAVAEEVLAGPGAARGVRVGRRGRARRAAAPAVGGVDGEVVARGARARQAGARGRRSAPRRVDLRALAARVRRQAGIDRLAGGGARLAGGAKGRQAGAAGVGRGAAGRAVDAAGAPGRECGGDRG